MFYLKKIWIIFSLFILTALTGCGNNSNNYAALAQSPETIVHTTQPDSQLENEIYTSKDGEIQFQYPSSWEIKDVKDIKTNPPAEVFISNKDGTSINLVITTSPVLAPSAEEQAQKLSENFRLMGEDYGIKDFKEISLKPINIDGIKATVFTYNATISQSEDIVKLSQLIVPYIQQTYTLTMATGDADWPNYEQTFQDVISSFHFVKG